MYRNYYMQASQMADMLQSGALADQKSAQRKSQQEGLMNRISSRVEEDSGFDVTKYLSNMRSTLKKEGPAVEGGSVTGMAVPDIEELPEGTVRPKGRTEIPKGEVVDKVYNGLLERGVPEHVAKGFLLNFQDESGFNIDIEEVEPNIYGTRGKGLYQLTNDRRDAFEAKYGNDYSIDNQLDWLVYTELQGTEKSAYEKMLNTSTPGEAGSVIVKEFLRPAKKHQESRSRKYLSATGYTEE